MIDTERAIPDVPAPLAQGVTREYLLHHRVCPKRLVDHSTLVVALAPGAFCEALDELAVVYQRRIVCEDATDVELERLIERTAAAADSTVELARIETDGEANEC